MKKFGHTKVYLLVASLLFVGLLFFIFKDLILSQARDFFIDEVIIGEERPVEIISNLEIVETERLEGKERKALYFDFNVLGRKAPPGIEDSNLPIFETIYPGNNNPFR